MANFPFATIAVNGTYRFYSINLTTGQAFSLVEARRSVRALRPQSGGDWSDVPISSLGSGVVHVTGNAQLSGVLD